MRIIKTAAVSALLLGSVSAHADFFGTLSGRSANPANSPQLSVEGSFTTSGDYQNIGARVNYGVNELLTVYGDFGLSEIGGFGADFDGNSFGIGIFYHLPNLSESSEMLNTMDVAVQASFHTASLEFNSFEIDQDVITGVLLISPKTVMNPENGMNWYANAGLARATSDSLFGGSDSDIEIQIGGGIYLPVGSGTFYAGADLVDEFIFGAGYRFGLQ